MKNVLIFNDISGLGNCSMSANLPILTKLGHYCMPIVTGSYSCQTGFDGFLVSKNDRVAEFAENLMKFRKPDAVYVGFCNDVATLRGATDVVRRCVGDEGVFTLVDPILGDNGKLYPVFDDSYVEEMKRIVALADCITPNLTEACLLQGVDYGELTSHKGEPTFLAHCGKVFGNFLATVGAKTAVITGIECGTLIGNLVLDGEKLSYVTNERVDVSYSGTGDVFSSVVAGLTCNGYKLLTATQVAANFVEKAARATDCADRRFGVEFARVLDLL